MKKRDFIKLSSLAGITSILPGSKSISTLMAAPPPDACVLIPSETAGPFPLDLTANTAFFRRNIVEDRTGVPFKVRIKILGLDNCGAMQNVRVNIWHCDRVGNYSGYGTEVGKTYLRGYQITDSNGIVEFDTIFPGWYNGRICHIHFQVYVSSSYSAVSQLTYDIPTKNALYAAYTSLYTKGADPLSFNQDGIFSDGYQYQLSSLTDNGDGTYSSYLEVTVKGAGVLNKGYAELQAAKYFQLGQNFPNPYQDQTTIPFRLESSGHVELSIYDLQGNKIVTLVNKLLGSGDHKVVFKPIDHGLESGGYVYQLRLSNEEGKFSDVKMMTALGY